MNTTKILETLYQFYSALNFHYWDNELPEEIFITLQQGRKKNKNVYGTFYADSYAERSFETNPETGEAIEDIEGTFHEISMGAEFLTRPVAEIIATLQHEMCHLYARINNIQDTSRGGQFHNKKFKQIGEKHGLILECDEKNGWTITSPSEELKDFISNLNIDTSPFNYFRMTYLEPSNQQAKKRWICPKCKQIINASKKANLICGNCDMSMDYWDITEEDSPIILEDKNDGYAMNIGWYYSEIECGGETKDEDFD